MGMKMAVYVGPYFETQNKKEVYPFDVASEFSESLWHQKIGVKNEILHWMPNQHRKQPREFVIDGEGMNMIFAEDDNLVESEKQWLNKYFNKEKYLLKTRYGECELRWGIFTFWW